MLMERKPRHLSAVETIDAGLYAASQITIEQGIVDAIVAGRMTQEEGDQCLAAYERTFHRDNVVELHPDIPDGAA